MNSLKLITGTIVLCILFYSCDKNEFAPEVADQEFTIAENSSAGSDVGTVSASDADEGQVVSFEINDGNINGTFEIDASSGVLSVSNPASLNYEESTQIMITVSVADSHDKDPMESSAKIQINLTDVNEFAPVANNQVFELDENVAGGTEIGSVLATDSDSHQELIYDILPSSDDGYTAINANTGNLTILDSSAFDFESREQIVVSVRVTDNHANSMSDTATITVNILDVPELDFGQTTNYPFNGNTNDISGNNYHFTDPGLEYGTDRKNSARETISLTGSMGLSLLSQEFNNQSEPQSISLWFKTASLNSVDYGGLMFGILGRGEAGSGSRFILSMKEGAIRAGYGDEWGDDSKWNENFESGVPLNDDKWHHVVFITNGDDQTAYLIIDNEVVESRELIKSNHNRVNYIDFKIGGDKVENYFTGEIDEIIYYHRALTLEEVEAIYVGK